MLIETALIIVIIIVVITEFMKAVYPYIHKKELFQECNLMKRNIDPSFRLRDVSVMPWQNQ
jgi:hypothetical protein